MPENEHTMVLVSIDQKAALAAGKNTTASKMRVAVDFTTLSPEVRKFLASNIDEKNLEIAYVCHPATRKERYVTCRFEVIEPTHVAVVAKAEECLRYFEEEDATYKRQREEALESKRAELLRTVASRTIFSSRSLGMSVTADIDGKQVAIPYVGHYIPEPNWQEINKDPFQDIRESADYRMLAAEVAKKNSEEAERAIQRARVAAAEEITKKIAAASAEKRLLEVTKQLPDSKLLLTMHEDGVADTGDLKDAVVEHILEYSRTLRDKNYSWRKLTMAEYETWTALRERGQKKAKDLGIEDLVLSVESKALEYRKPSYDDDALVTLMVDIGIKSLGISHNVEVVLAGDDAWATRY